MKDKINIAVLGDLHGHFTLAYRLLKRWEIEHDETVDLILQVGDLGAFPETSRLDKATLKFAKRDFDEISFIDYYNGSSEADEILGENAVDSRKIAADMYFIKGNHEDFEFLDSVTGRSRKPVPVDYYQRMFYIRNGLVFNLEISDVKLRIAGMGGLQFNSEFKKKPAAKFYTNSEYREIISSVGILDIFLTHDVPLNAISEDADSEEILDIIERLNPKYHFCGHYHIEGRELEVTDTIQSYILNEVNFRGSRGLNKRCIGILSWFNRENNYFEF